MTTPRPIRIQRKRTKGWRMPANTVYVGRPSKWGNPFHTHHDVPGGYPMAPEIAVASYRRMLIHEGGVMANGDAHSRRLGPIITTEDVKVALKGKNLACWCSLDQPCHADVLLQVANS